jgi:hypothetical protein
MKHIYSSNIRFLTFALISCSLTLRAAAPAEVKWSQLCQEAAGDHVAITTASGETIDGYCLSINVEEVSIRTDDNRIVKVARTALSRVHIHPKFQRHQLATLRQGVRKGLHDGFDLLFSPYAPAGAVLLPATLVWGAVVTPFCALGELKNKLEEGREIKVI